MTRTLKLDAWAGKWVALDADDRVVLTADELETLLADVDRDDLDVLILRAPVPGEPLAFGLC